MTDSPGGTRKFCRELSALPTTRVYYRPNLFGRGTPIQLARVLDRRGVWSGDHLPGRFVSGHHELATILGERFKARTTAEWVTLLEGAGVPAGPVASVGEMLELPQTLAREMVLEVEHSLLGSVGTVGFPVKFSETPGSVRRGAPVLGEHTREMLGELGYTDEQVEDLVRSGAAVCRKS